MVEKKKAVKKEDMFEDGDDSLVIDFDKVEGQSFESIPKGTYAVVIEECEFKMSQSSGKPMWNMVLTISEGEFTGRKLFTFLSFSEKALPGTKTQITRIAPELLRGPFDPKKIAAEGSLIGKIVRVKTKLETYEGEERTKVASFLTSASSDGFED